MRLIACKIANELKANNRAPYFYTFQVLKTKISLLQDLFLTSKEMLCTGFKKHVY